MSDILYFFQSKNNSISNPLYKIKQDITKPSATKVIYKKFFYDSVPESTTITNIINYLKHNKNFINIYSLINYNLIEPIKISIEYDEDKIFIKTVDYPLHTIDKNYKKALKKIKTQIELLYQELNEDDNMTEEWSVIKNRLNKIIK